MPYRTVSKSVSIRRDDLAYVLEVAAKEKSARRRTVSFSEVMTWGVRALRKLRHDVPGKASSLELTAEARARKAVTSREAIDAVRTVARELAEMKGEVQSATTPEAGTPAARTSAASARAGARGAGRSGA